MRLLTRVGASCLAASVAVLAASVPAAAAPKPITGKLSKPGYTVIALADESRASSVRTRAGKFRLRPPAESVTLHLRAANGKYAGPIVIGRQKRGRRAILGVRAGARLGRIRVRRGYARVSRRPRKKWVDGSRVARARRGVPIGAGNYGRVRSRVSRASAAARSRPGQDRDLDGIPGALDIDDDGDLLLDNFERRKPAGAAQADEQLTDPVGFKSALVLRAHETVNANAAALTRDDIDAALRTFGTLSLAVLPETYAIGDSAELDCGLPQKRTNPTLGGLVYCTRGGTGMKAFYPPAGEFPEDFDRDGDGLGTLTHPFFLLHGAGTADIGTGDILIEWVASGVPENQCPPASPGSCDSYPSTLQFVFATVPALVSYSDTAGNCARVSGTPGSCATEFSYPIAAPTPGCPPPGCPPGGPGTFGNGFPVTGAGGDVELTLTFWRPQRTAIPPETAEWIDIGGLTYAVAGISDPDAVPPPPGTWPTGPCPRSAYSETDPNLTLNALPSPNTGFLEDSAADQPASAANTVTYTLNVTRCLAAYGLSWDPGQQLEFRLQVSDNQDIAEQLVNFRRR
jgi:hypothetical protein